MKKLRVVTVFGTRPEAVKMAPLVKELEKNDLVESIVCVTAQHRQMLDQVLNKFEITPDYDLNIMQQSQSLEHILTKALEGLTAVFEKVKPDVVLVHGDTSTTFAGSLAAFYKKIDVGHVEAGLRTYDKYSPWPEEMNRRLTGVLSDWHFAPTKANKANLLREGVDEKKIYVTGNTVIDALKTTVKEDFRFRNEVLKSINFAGNRVITVEVHRRENLGEPIRDICRAIRYIADNYKDVLIIYPVHPNPAVQQAAHEILDGHDRIKLIGSLDTDEMHNLMNKSYFILTDSGGLQEEAPSLGKPVIVARNETERPEAVKAGTVKIAGTKKEDIIVLASQLLDDRNEYEKMAKAVNPYGDGRASERIVQALLYEYGLSDVKPQEFRS